MFGLFKKKYTLKELQPQLKPVQDFLQKVKPANIYEQAAEHSLHVKKFCEFNLFNSVSFDGYTKDKHVSHHDLVSALQEALSPGNKVGIMVRVIDNKDNNLSFETIDLKRFCNLFKEMKRMMERSYKFIQPTDGVDYKKAIANDAAELAKLPPYELERLAVYATVCEACTYLDENRREIARLLKAVKNVTIVNQEAVAMREAVFQLPENPNTRADWVERFREGNLSRVSADIAPPR